MRWISLSLVLASCATLEGVKPPLQDALEKKLLNQTLYAQCALHRAHFYDDPTRDLITEHRPNARHLALNSAGKPLLLTAKTNRVHPGSPWSIERISSPTSFERVMRPLRSPRHATWLHLRSGASRAVLVVPSGLTNADEIAAWLKRLFAAAEPTGFTRLNPALRSAVVHGRVVADMNPEQLRLALCPPDRTFMDVRAMPPVEKWIYLHQGGDHRAVVLLDGKATGRLIPMNDEELKALETSTQNDNKAQSEGSAVEAK